MFVNNYSKCKSHKNKAWQVLIYAKQSRYQIDQIQKKSSLQIQIPINHKKKKKKNN